MLSISASNLLISTVSARARVYTRTNDSLAQYLSIYYTHTHSYVLVRHADICQDVDRENSNDRGRGGRHDTQRQDEAAGERQRPRGRAETHFWWASVRRQTVSKTLQDRKKRYHSFGSEIAGGPLLQPQSVLGASVQKTCL